MVSVCTTCKGLQRHLRALDSGAKDSETEPLQWLNTTLPSLRRSSTNGGCRACSLLLQGILLHHDRFADVNEDSIKISAESFNSSEARQGDGQHHLSVEIRWKALGEGCCEGNEHEHDEGYPDLKLEFYTDKGARDSSNCIHYKLSIPSPVSPPGKTASLRQARLSFVSR
jgi:hypothetical protein